MNFKWDIVGHEKILNQIEGEIIKNKLAHAYLFSGPKQVGKFRLAKQFADILQSQGGVDPNKADTTIIHDDGTSIKIDQIRELVRKTNLTTQSPHRIYVIQNIERMPIEAQNSFLKTLEEPPQKTIFILTTSQPSKVLTTIESRVRHYHFSMLSNQVLKDYLIEHFGEKSQINEVVSIAQGQPGLAIAMMENPQKLTEMKTLYMQIESFLKNNDLARKFSYVEEISSDAELAEAFLEAFTRYLRKVLYDFVEGTSAIKQRFDHGKLISLFESLEESRYLMQRNVNKKLVLENLMIKTEV